MTTYQVISVDLEQIKKDIDNCVITVDEVVLRGKKFLDELVKTDFEVYQSSKFVMNLPSQFLIGGADMLAKKKTVYDIALRAELGKYIGNGEFYTEMPR